MSKTLCKLKKDLPKNLETMLRLALNPTHICKDCGRVSNDELMVCSPKKIDKILNKQTTE